MSPSRIRRTLLTAALLAIQFTINAGTQASDFDPAPAWPLCGRISEAPPPGWQDSDGCPATRFGNAGFGDAPLAYTFGPRLLYSGGDRYDFHRGLDIPTPISTPIFAIADAIVQSAGNHPSFTDPMIRLRHYRPGVNSCSDGGCYHSLYLHISGWVVAEGDRISKGQLIGYTGATSASGWEHLHFEIRNAPAWDPFSSWSRDAINVLSVLPYAQANDTQITFDSVTSGPLDTVKAQISITSSRFDLQRVEMRVYDIQMREITQPGNQPNANGYYINPPFYDLEETNFQYTHKDSSNVPWSSFQENGSSECPYHTEHGNSYDATVHLDRQNPLDFQQGLFNGVRIITSKYWHNNEYSLQLEFQELLGPATCIQAEALFASGDSTSAQWGNCDGSGEPPLPTLPAAPSELVATINKTGKGRNAVTSVQLNWVDNADNETSIIVERCEKLGKGKQQSCDYEEISSLPANSSTYSESPGSGKFKYRVKSSNETGDSQYSNEVEI